MIHNISRFIAALALLATAQTARAWLTDFVAVSQQGTATARFAYSDHFYRVDWSGINSVTTTVKLDFITSGTMVAQRNGNTSSFITLYASESSSDRWCTSHITGLTPGQSSDGYTNYADLATGASSGKKKVCTVTCLSASAPTWAWSADRSACTATFTCAEDATLTATVTATVTAAGGSITASATFNGTAYSDTKTDPWGRSDGRDGSEAKPYAIGSPEALALLSDYVNAGNNASGLHFEQTQDIDMSSAGNFTPIGYDKPFNGIYDGKGHAITGLTVNTTSPNAALFGYMEGGSIRNVTMVNPSLTCSFSGSGDKRAGGIVSSIRPGTIMNCNVINPTLRAGYKGAICGTINGGGWCEVRDCYYYTTGSVGAVGLNPLNQTVTGGRIYTLTLASGVTTSTAPAFTYGGTGYYAGTITLGAAPTGWTYAYSVNGSAISGNTFDISADASVTVTRTPIDYTITYNLGGGTNASGNPATYTIQSPAITLAAPTRTGYTFGGWYANSGLTGNQVTTIGGGSTGNVELWAKWTPTQYTINYNLGGGTNHGDNPSTYTVESAAIALGAATRTGYQFGGWYASADCSGDAVTTIATGTTGDVELWAKWTANRYAIAFVGNGKTDGTMYNELFYYDEAKALTTCAYTRTGYHFNGWNTESDGSGTAYTDGQEVLNLTAEPDATLTLYAQWTANTYTVHFVAGIPVNGEMADQTFTYDQEATALTKNAFSTTTGQWLRWNTKADGSGTNYEDEQQVQNLTAEDGGTVTLYAQWHLQHRYNYDNTIFRCYNVGNSNQVYWAYADEAVKVEVIDGTSEYTIRVVNGDGEDITLDTETNTFVMPNEEVWITYTSVKKIAYTTICLDDFDSSDDVAYLYDASQPTVTPTVVVKDGETVLTEGTDYTLAITNNTGSATQMVTATVTVTGMGGYVGTNTREFRITPFNIANCEIKGMEAYDDGYGVYYPLSKNVEVWNGDTKLTLDTDYSLDVEYAESYEVGQSYNATVKGLGDWGGSKTFQFKVVELHHTVVFVANGGSGTMASDVATKGQHYNLPACGFTAPLGKVFDHWVVDYTGIEENPIKQPDDYFTAPYIYNESDVQTITVTAYWRDKATFTVTLPEDMEVVSGTLTDGKAIEDEVITFRPRPGFTATDVQANGTALTPDGEGIYTLTVTADVTVTVGALAPIDWATVNQGTDADPYMIYNKDQLLLLAHRVNGTSGETVNTYEGKYFKLGADITFDHDADEGDDYAENYEAIGGYYNSTDRYFMGNFDGDGHTVSGIRIRKTGSGYANYYQGLFGQTGYGAVIHDVHLTDARITGFYYVGGIIGPNTGTVSGCTVTDSYITAGDGYGTICGGNVGTLTNNYYHGCTVNGTAVTSGVGCRGADITANNGALPAYAITLGDGVSTTVLASEPENGFVKGGISYYRLGLALPLASEAPEGYTLSFSANGTALSGNTYTVNATDCDVTLSAAIRSDGLEHEVSYMTADGTTKTAKAIALDGHETVGGTGFVHLDEGTYYVGTDIATANRIWLDGDVTLILANGKTMTLNGWGIAGGYDLTIYGQSLDAATAGTLRYDGTSDGINADKYVQHSGNVSITTTGSSVLGIDARVTLRGGTLTISANGDNARAISGTRHSILGGQLTATATGTTATGILASDLILGWTRPDDCITASSISTEGGTVAVADGKALTDGSGNIYTGTLTASELSGFAAETTLQPCLALADAASNTAAITDHAGQTLAVALSGRTLYKDGSWNTLCLPFSVSTASGTLSDDGVKAMTLNTTTSSLADGTLTLNFDDAKGQTIPAGTPFIIKWNNTGVNIENPVFEDVTVSKATNDATVDGVLTFTGTYAPVKIADGGDNTKLYLGSGNKLYYPNAAMTIGCQRAYFQLLGDLTAGKPAGEIEQGKDQEDPVRAFVLNFGDDEANGILSVSAESSREALPAAWYTLDGRRLDGQPTAKGLYIHGGKKVIVK